MNPKRDREELLSIFPSAGLYRHSLFVWSVSYRQTEKEERDLRKEGRRVYITIVLVSGDNTRCKKGAKPFCHHHYSYSH